MRHIRPVRTRVAAGRVRLVILSAGLLLLVGGLLVAIGYPCGIADAQEGEWVEVETEGFIILHQPGDEVHAETLRARVADIYGDMAESFGTELDGPITVRLYPSLPDYLEAEPLAIEVEGLIAQTHRSRREIGLPLDYVLQSGPEGVVNHARYALAHLFAYRLSEGRLAAGLQEGIAQYLMRPGEKQAAGVARLREAWHRDGLLRWSDLASPGSAYLDPPIGYPQALSIIHFMVEEGGFASVCTLLRAAASEPGWRSAVEQALGDSADRLESRWLAWLPSYLDGGWRFHALYSRDLSAAQALLERGEYDAAAAHLAAALPLLSEEDPQLAAEARRLLEKVDAAERARAHLVEARASLAAADYATALAESTAALEGGQQLGFETVTQTAAELQRRAQMGLDAERSLAQARELPPWRFASARALAKDAAVGFARLGNDVAAREARELGAGLDRRQAPAGLALLAAGLALLGANVVKRNRMHRSRPGLP